MKVKPLSIPEVLLVEPKVHEDSRGFFLESYHRERYREHGIHHEFIQDNISLSQQGVLRGLHIQHPQAQGKLVQVLAGEVFDVAVDIRVGSPTFGRWAGAALSAANKHQLWVPPGFAHGFLVVSEQALFCYKCTELYAPQNELVLLWNDPDIGIQWPLAGHAPLLSQRDAAGLRLNEVPKDRLPRYPS